jgi:hypothetical protein
MGMVKHLAAIYVPNYCFYCQTHATFGWICHIVSPNISSEKISNAKNITVSFVWKICQLIISVRTRWTLEICFVYIYSCAKVNVKKVGLELGGKSPLIIFHDCDLDKAVRMVCTVWFLFQQLSCCFCCWLLVYTYFSFIMLEAISLLKHYLNRSWN